MNLSNFDPQDPNQVRLAGLLREAILERDGNVQRTIAFQMRVVLDQLLPLSADVIAQQLRLSRLDFDQLCACLDAATSMQALKVAFLGQHYARTEGQRAAAETLQLLAEVNALATMARRMVITCAMHGAEGIAASVEEIRQTNVVGDKSPVLRAGLAVMQRHLDCGAEPAASRPTQPGVRRR